MRMQLTSKICNNYYYSHVAYINLTQPDKDSLSIVIGFLNTFQWIYISILPILMVTLYIT